MSRFCALAFAGVADVVPVGTLEDLRVYARAILKLHATPSKVFSSTGDEILAQNYEQLRGEFTDGDVVYVSCGEPWRTPGQPRMRDKVCSYFTRVSLFSTAAVLVPHVLQQLQLLDDCKDGHPGDDGVGREGSAEI